MRINRISMPRLASPRLFFSNLRAGSTLHCEIEDLFWNLDRRPRCQCTANTGIFYFLFLENRTWNGTPKETVMPAESRFET